MRTVVTIALLIATGEVRGDGTVDYERDVKPLLLHKCVACHGTLKQSGGLRLDAGELIRRGGESGAVVRPGDSGGSVLIERVSAADAELRMPPEGEGEALTAAQLSLLSRWIDEGARSPAGEAIPADPASYWSYQPIARPAIPAIPAVSASAWVRNPVDTFVAARHESLGLLPRTEAPREVWLRRVYLDLIGLPPTREQLHAFLADESTNACEKVVDELLERPEYGERWGRHWMDVWRYSDWYGSRRINEIRYSQRHIWRWRDWIIESLNADKPYDRMVVEMLAGDELAPSDPEVLRATGFLGRNWYKFDRNVWMFETVEQTSQAFLALTLRCARCHDHKYDPVTQEDYYRFRAFFEPHNVRTDPLAAGTAMEKDATLGMVLTDGVSRVFDRELEAATFVYQRGDDRYPDESRPMSPGVPAALGSPAVEVQPVPLSVEAYYPQLRGEIADGLIAAAERTVREAEASLEQARTAAIEAEEALKGAKSRGERGEGEEGGPKPAVEELQKSHHAAASRAALSGRKLATSRAEAESVRTRVAAERAKYFGQDDEAVRQAALAASVAERQAAVARADEAVLEAEQQHAAAVASQKPAAGESPEAKGGSEIMAAEKKVAEARRKLDDAKTALGSPDGKYAPLGEVYPAASTGRRLALARWIASTDNRRTARVAVNQIWLRHFGQALVPTVANFGLNGDSPSHPELLDWLAAELIENNWRMKPLHRMLVLSATYRQSTAAGSISAEDRAAEIDPANRFLWRMNSRRMEAEVVRDSVLFAAGTLDAAHGGPEIPENEAQAVFRRSLYFRNTPNEKVPFLETFDVANPNECYRRQESVVPQQALALMNSSLAIDQSRKLAEMLTATTAGPDEEQGRDAFITAAFETVLSRRPTPAEVSACRSFLDRNSELVQSTDQQAFPAGGGTFQRKPSPDPRQRARENLVHVLYSHNDFVTIR